MAISSV